MDKMFFNNDLNTDTKGAIAFRKHFRVNLEKTPAELPNKDVHEMRRQIQDSMSRTLDQVEKDGRDLTPSEDDAFRYGQMLLDEINFQLDRRKAEGTDQPIVPRTFHGENGIASRGGQVETIQRKVFRPGELRSFRDMGGCNDSHGFQNAEEFLEVLLSGRFDPRLREARTFLAGTGTAGGFAVPTQYSPLILDAALNGGDSIVMPRANIIPVTTAGIEIPIWDSFDHSGSTLFGGLQGTWIDENTASDIQTGKLVLLSMAMHKCACYAEASREASDAIGLIEQIITALKTSVSYTLDLSFLTGDGVGKPLGVLNSPSIITVNRATANQVAYTDIVNLYSRMAPACLLNAVWVISPSVVPQLAQVRDSGNNNIWIQSAAAGVPGTLLGKPVLMTEKTPALGSKGDIMLVDFSRYLIGLRQELVIDRSNAPGWTRDVESFRCIVRVDGQCLWKSAITPTNGGSTLSWAVALDVP